MCKNCALVTVLEKIFFIELRCIPYDIGKIGISKEILNKRGALEPDEFEQIRSHVACGYRILKNIPFTGPVAEAVLQHHERYDGTGYPHGLAGRQILLEARILAVADVFEALCSDRPYRAGLDPTYVANYMIKNSGTHFCPECIAAFKGLFFDADIFACN
ncbi:MAG: HD domain-containing protein [Deltaproteobacteria bacterium]|nr:HD domain-containing protein [Deltaproteobacteria bacterium]